MVIKIISSKKCKSERLKNVDQEVCAWPKQCCVLLSAGHASKSGERIKIKRKEVIAYPANGLQW